MADDEQRIIIDMRRKPQEGPGKELDADLIIEIDMISEDDYFVVYLARDANGTYFIETQLGNATRAFMLEYHVLQLRTRKPKSVVVRTGKNSSGHVRDIPLHPGVIKSIIEGKLGAAELMLRS